MKTEKLKAPFPWFGSKSKVAKVIWEYFGADIPNYVEPFAGSLAVLLNRPEFDINKMETVNDKDGYIVNFWRAIKYDPAGVAYYANNNPNEIDLTARHIWLVNEGKERLDRLFGDPEYYDSKVAGWWVYGISLWIGGSWCSGKGKWTAVDGKLISKDELFAETDNVGFVSMKRQHVGRGLNIHKFSSRTKNRGFVSKRILQITSNMGIHRNNLRNKTYMNTGVRFGEQNIYDYFNTLAERLRYVRILNGDWERSVTKGALTCGSKVGIFLDPPYSKDLRYRSIYTSDNDIEDNINQRVYKWCLENQDNPRYWIALCGFEGEYDLPGWYVYKWSTDGSLQTSKGGGRNKENRHKERIWFNKPFNLNRDEV